MMLRAVADGGREFAEIARGIMGRAGAEKAVWLARYYVASPL
jgi:hypothetical protein